MGRFLRRALAALAWAGCALAGAQSTATIADSATANRTSGDFFMVTAVDGKDVENAQSASRRASAGQGARVSVVPFERSVAAGKVTLKLRGIRASGMPAVTILRSLFRGGEPVVDGGAAYELEAGKRYRVNGVLDDYRREVWLEDEAGKLVGARFSAAADPALVKAMEGAVYVATNLRYDDDWIEDEPWLDRPLVPAGARIKVVGYGRSKADVLIDGRKMRIGVEQGAKVETIQQLVTRLTSSDDPRPKMAEWPEAVRDAVAAGKVVYGMTREQVVMALGRPRKDLVPSLDAAEWPYRLHEDEEVFVVFASDGRLVQVDASRKARKRVLMDAPAATAAGASAPAAASAPS